MSNDNNGLLSTIINASKDIIIILSESYVVIKTNDTFKKFFPEYKNIAGKNFLKCCENKLVPLSKSECDGLISGLTIDKEIALSSDEIYYFSWASYIVHEKDDESHILFIAKNNTDTKHISFLNKQNQTQLERISKVVPGNFYWKNLEGEYLGCNLSLATMLGMDSVEDIVGKNDDDLWPEQAEELRHHDKEVVLTKKTMSTEESVKLADKIMYFTVIKMPLYGENDRVIGVLGNSLDITNQKIMEQELRKAKERAEIGEKAKTDFIANISHDMRTPLSGIISVAHDLKGDDISEGERKEFSTQLAEAAEALLAMFEEVLEDVAAENMKESDIKLETFDLNLLVDRVVKLEKPSLNQKGLKFVTNVDPNIPQYLVSDHRKIHRIVLNLIGNAVKFTKQGYIELKIELVDKKQIHVTLKFHIIDTGIEFTQKLRAFEKENNKSPVPIVGVTAHAANGRSECLDAGMNAVIQKPLTPALLTEILQKFLSV